MTNSIEEQGTLGGSALFGGLDGRNSTAKKSAKPKRLSAGEAGNRLGRILERIPSIDGTSDSRVFDEFLEITELTLLRLPDQYNAVQRTGKIEEKDPPEVTERWNRVVANHKRPQVVFELLAQGFAYLVEATMDESGSLTYTDVLGETYMEFVQHGGSGPLGQYFTPQHVTKLMAAITMSEVDALVKQRIREALEKSPEAQVMGLVSSVLPDPVEGGGTTWRYLLPLLAPYYQPVLVLDPCVGSGRMLLAAAEAAPRVYTDLGLIQFYGMDIDPTCVQMTRINTMLYGLNGWSYVMEKQGRPAVQVPVRGEIVEVERAPEGVIARLPEPVRSAYQELRLDPVRTDRARLRKRVVEGQMGMFSEEPELPIAK